MSVSARKRAAVAGKTSCDTLMTSMSLGLEKRERSGRKQEDHTTLSSCARKTRGIRRAERLSLHQAAA